MAERQSRRTVNVGFSMEEEVDDSAREVEETSSASSSARTWPNSAAVVHRVERSAGVRRILTDDTAGTEV